MNHIKRLQQENLQKDRALKALNVAVAEFRKHLRSSKFHNDPTIQVSDVHAWLDRILQDVADQEAGYSDSYYAYNTKGELVTVTIPE